MIDVMMVFSLQCLAQVLAEMFGQSRYIGVTDIDFSVGVGWRVELTVRNVLVAFLQIDVFRIVDEFDVNWISGRMEMGNKNVPVDIFHPDVLHHIQFILYVVHVLFGAFQHQTGHEAFEYLRDPFLA